jgi:predicted hydrocarbon binding protein
MFKEEREESQFEWSMLGDIELGRPNLGSRVHVVVYRLMQFTLRDILIRDFGVEKADQVFFEAGKEAGKAYCDNILTEKKDLNGLFADLQRTMKDLGIGIFRVESADLEKNTFVITIAEDLDCPGLPVCYSGKDFDVKEVDCWGSGGRVCRFTVVPK